MDLYDEFTAMPVWKDRVRVRWEGGDLWVVSRQGLTSLKQLRGSGQDRDDIQRLAEEDT